MKNLLLCLLNTLLMIGGQILFKYGSQGRDLHNLIDIVKLFFTPAIFSALCLYALTSCLWIYILSSVPISFAYPIQALAFPVVLIVSIFLFEETVSPIQWIGVSVIILGVFIATKG